MLQTKKINSGAQGGSRSSSKLEDQGSSAYLEKFRLWNTYNIMRREQRQSEVGGKGG